MDQKILQRQVTQGYELINSLNQASDMTAKKRFLYKNGQKTRSKAKDLIMNLHDMIDAFDVHLQKVINDSVKEKAEVLDSLSEEIIQCAAYISNLCAVSENILKDKHSQFESFGSQLKEEFLKSSKECRDLKFLDYDTFTSLDLEVDLQEMIKTPIVKITNNNPRNLHRQVLHVLRFDSLTSLENLPSPTINATGKNQLPKIKHIQMLSTVNQEMSSLTEISEKGDKKSEYLSTIPEEVTSEIYHALTDCTGQNRDLCDNVETWHEPSPASIETKSKINLRPCHMDQHEEKRERRMQAAGEKSSIHARLNTTSENSLKPSASNNHHIVASNVIVTSESTTKSHLSQESVVYSKDSLKTASEELWVDEVVSRFHESLYVNTKEHIESVCDENKDSASFIKTEVWERNSQKIESGQLWEEFKDSQPCTINTTEQESVCDKIKDPASFISTEGWERSSHKIESGQLWDEFKDSQPCTVNTTEQESWQQVKNEPTISSAETALFPQNGGHSENHQDEASGEFLRQPLAMNFSLKNALSSSLTSGSVIHGRHVKTVTGGSSTHFDHPTGLTVRGDGLLVMADTGHNLVKVLQGNSLIFSIGGKDGVRMKRPSAVVCDDQNNMYVKDDCCIHAFDPQGKCFKTIGLGLFRSPFGLSLVKSGSESYLVLIDQNYKAPKLYTYAISEDKLRSHCYLPLVNFGTPASKVRFIGAFSNQVLASDLGASTMYLSDLTGKIIKSFGSYGHGPGDCIEPSGVTMDGQGAWLVADSKNNRVQAFNQDGVFLASVHLDEPIRRPSGIHLTNDGKLYIINYLDSVIKVFQLKK